MKWKKAVSLALIGTMMASLAGCGSTGGGTSDQAADSGTQERTIKVMTIWNEDVQGGTQTLKALSDEYCAEHPEITVEIEVVAQTDMPSRLSVLAASGELPDLFIATDTAQSATFYEQGLIYSVDDFLEENGIQDIISESTRQGLINVQAAEGDELYTLPTEQNIEGFWYNKQMFEENGWEVPETMDEFMAICEDAVSKGIQPLSVDGMDKFYFTRLWGGYVTSKLGVDALINANAGEQSFSDPAFLEAYQWVQDLNTNGYMGEGVTTIDSSTMNSVFLTGGAAMEYNGSWVTSNLNNEEENQLGENVGFFGFPSVDGAVADQNDYCQNYGTAWVIGSNNYDDALNDWLVYVFSGYGDKSMETQGMLSGFEMKEEHEMPYYTQMVVDLIAEAGEAAVWPEYKMETGAMQTSLDNSQLLILGEMTPEDYGVSLDAFYE
ncbi:MAG TPA: extracellular solute-binding protein [Candidatus Mediterraneibacter norfolkensis]|nr:extracellular solute-binding protein [Candidatus Mediterraneibacter norfolkensis]